MRKLSLFLFALALALAGQAAAAAAELPAAVQRYIDENTMAVARLDVGKFDADSIVRFLEEVSQDAPAEDRQQMLEEARTNLQQATEQIRPLKDAGVTRMYVIVGPGMMQGQMPLFVVPTQGEQQAGVVEQYAQQFGRTAKRAEGAVIVGDAQTLQAAEMTRAAPRPEFAQGLGGEGEAMVQVAFVPTPMIKMFAAQGIRQLAEQQRQMQGQGGAEGGAQGGAQGGQQQADLVKAAEAFEKLEMITFHFDAPPQVRLHSETRFTDAATAEQMLTASRAQMATLQQQAANDPQAAAALEMLKGAEPKVQGNALVVDLNREQITQFVRRAIAEQAKQKQQQGQEGGDGGDDMGGDE